MAHQHATTLASAAPYRLFKMGCIKQVFAEVQIFSEPAHKIKMLSYLVIVLCLITVKQPLTETLFL